MRTKRTALRNNYTQKQSKNSRWAVLLSGGMLFCLLLLSACSESRGESASAASAAVPVVLVDASLQNQGMAQLQTFEQWIALTEDFGGDVTSYQKQYTTDQQALKEAQNNEEYEAAIQQLKTHVTEIKLPAMKTQSLALLNKLNQKVESWGKAHQYYNRFDKTSYALGFEYGPIGIGGWAQEQIDAAETLAHYQQTVEDLKMYLTNFEAMTTNSSDKTPFNKPHKTDLQLMDAYGKTKTKVVIVSLYEQALRVYENGKLIKAFLVTTGRPTRPSLPGSWWVEIKQAPTIFKSGVPKSSPDYYPDTPINFAMQYHSGGYFIHDSWWRLDYGPGTQFPHEDSGHAPTASTGSHGCVNLPKEETAWIYKYVQLDTSVIIY